MNITFKGDKTTITYFDVSPCQNSDEYCHCQLHGSGIELPTSETGECRIQFQKPKDCDSFEQKDTNMEQGYKLEPLPFCKGCTYLGKRLQNQYGLQFMRPFCQHYQLHFASVRQISNIHSGCPHYDEGHL